MLGLRDLASQGVSRVALTLPDGGGGPHTSLPLRGSRTGSDKGGGEGGVGARAQKCRRAVTRRHGSPMEDGGIGPGGTQEGDQGSRKGIRAPCRGCCLQESVEGSLEGVCAKSRMDQRRSGRREKVLLTGGRWSRVLPTAGGCSISAGREGHCRVGREGGGRGREVGGPAPGLDGASQGRTPERRTYGRCPERPERQRSGRSPRRCSSDLGPGKGGGGGEEGEDGGGRRGPVSHAGAGGRRCAGGSRGHGGGSR